MMLGCVSFTNTAFADTEAYNEEALQWVQMKLKGMVEDK